MNNRHGVICILCAFLSVSLLLMAVEGKQVTSKNPTKGVEKKKTGRSKDSGSPNFAVGLGVDLLMPLGSFRDTVPFAAAGNFSFQFASVGNFVIEADVMSWGLTLAKNESGLKKYYRTQTAGGLRYYFMDRFDGIYAGAGYGYTWIKSRFEKNGTSYRESDGKPSMMMKAGYAMRIKFLDPLFLDIGLRYDVYNFKNWGDQPAGLYMLLMYQF
jgi:hypothetical protein